MHIIKSKGVINCYKLAMLQFIAHFDEDIFYVPSGPEGLLPAIYCLKTNKLFLFKRMANFKGISSCTSVCWLTKTN